MTGGKGRAGKTATIRSLTGELFDPELKSTIGADAKNDCEVNIKYADNKWGLLNDEQKKEITSQHQARAMKINKKEEHGLKSSTATTKRTSILQRLRSSFTLKSTKDLFQPTSRTGIEIQTKPVPKIEKSDIKQQDHGTKSDANIEKNEKHEEEEKYELREEIINKYVNDEGIENKITMSIWDLDGQKVFYTLHHLFLTKFAVYLVVFDMRELINTNTQQVNESLDYIQHWLQSIHMHSRGAPIFIIGTHKDEVKDKKTAF